MIAILSRKISTFQYWHNLEKCLAKPITIWGKTYTFRLLLYCLFRA